MAATRDRLLPTAGGLLLGAGAVAALAGGAYGLAAQDPGVIVWSTLLMMGYGVVGYLLIHSEDRYFHIALPATAILVVATLALFQQGQFLDGPYQRYVLDPTISVLLVFAAGALLTHVAESMTNRAPRPSAASGSMNAVLHVAAYAPVWCAFTLLALRPNATPAEGLLVVAASSAISIAAVVGAYAAGRGNHPAFTVVGAGVAFLASGWYLYAFMAGTSLTVPSVLGQFHALVGLVLSGLPLAIGTVAWIQQSHEQPAADEPTQV